MPLRHPLRPILLAACMVVLLQPRPLPAAEEFQQRLSAGVIYRNQGQLTLSIETLTALHAQATRASDKALAAGELGASLLQARQLDAAEAPLTEAYRHFGGHERARYAIDLGNLAAARRQPDAARRHYREGAQLAGDDTALQAMAALNEARVLPANARLAALTSIAPQIDAVTPPATKARLALNLGNQARVLGQPALQLAWQQLNGAYQLARHDAAMDTRLRVESLDALAQLYEDQGRDAEALQLTREALGASQNAATSASPATLTDLLIQLHWRQGRIAARRREQELALMSYRAAVEAIEAIRPDIPIEYEDNRSSFRDTLEPIYLGLADLLLGASEKLAGEERSAALKQVRAVVELIKQTEMQDYLGDRCSVQGATAGADVPLPRDAAVLYPIILPDRLELLLETHAGMVRRTSAVPAGQLRGEIQEFTRRLRNEPDADLPQAQRLYDWLIRPLEADVASGDVKTLVVVPDGIIRTLPLAALHDGKQYLVERFALATSPGLTMIRPAPARQEPKTSLVAGLAEPGPVVDKLPSQLIAGILQAGEGSTTRSLSREALTRHARDALSLPGVRTEVESLSRRLGSRTLLNSAFTLADFSSSVGSGHFDVVHIASHGVFGGSGEESFILAYDEVLTMDRLQQLLRSEKLRKHPIRLLTLSACETAEGNERAPLGIAGAALKARAETALGTLWPVEDNAATLIMNHFYDGLVREKLGRAAALQRAQASLARQPNYRHPFFWAPFIIVGNWD